MVSNAPKTNKATTGIFKITAAIRMLYMYLTINGSIKKLNHSALS